MTEYERGELRRLIGRCVAGEIRHTLWASPDCPSLKAARSMGDVAAEAAIVMLTECPYERAKMGE